MYIRAKSKVPSSARMYFLAISSTRFLTSRRNARRRAGRRSSSVSSWIRRKPSSGNLASTGTSRSPIRMAASTRSPVANACCSMYCSRGSIWARRFSRRVSPTPPRIFGDLSSCSRPAMSRPTSKTRWVTSPSLPRLPCTAPTTWPTCWSCCCTPLPTWPISAVMRLANWCSSSFTVASVSLRAWWASVRAIWMSRCRSSRAWSGCWRAASSAPSRATARHKASAVIPTRIARTATTTHGHAALTRALRAGRASGGTPAGARRAHRPPGPADRGTAPTCGCGRARSRTSPDRPDRAGADRK